MGAARIKVESGGRPTTAARAGARLWLSEEERR